MADFQTFADELKALGIDIIAGSADPIEDARKAVDTLSLTYPLAYGMDVEKIAELLGGYFEVYKEANPITHSEDKAAQITGERAEVEKKFLQPIGVLLRPDKTIEVICYSSGHIGRMRAGEVSSLVAFYKSQK